MDNTSSSSPSEQAPPESVPQAGIGRAETGRYDHFGRPGRLCRRREGRMLAGVAGGLADFFDVDPTLVRVAFVALALLGGLAVPLYLAAWLLVPEEDADVSLAEELLARERAVR
jgi:phage shock protein PspC (stress-responsive transcriptional regulator)